MTQTTPTPLRFHTLAALALVFFAVFMTALISRTVFERLPHLEDEMAYLFQAKVFEHGDIVMASPTPRRAFWMPFVLDYTPPGGESVRFGKYTPGWPLLLALGVSMGQAWVVNAFCAGLTVALVFRLGSEVFDEDTGLIAAALTAFSPMALLLNATLMNHTSALTFTVLFMYGYWRMERPRQRRRTTLLWALLAGFALGMVAISRPLTAIALALPFAAWSVSRLIRGFVEPPSDDEWNHTQKQKYFGTAKTPSSPREDFQSSIQEHRENAEISDKVGLRERFAGSLNVLRPLVVMGLVTILISIAIPVFNYEATGDPFKNLYTLVWSYDRVGFGEGSGRNGHTLEKGLRHARFDLSLTAADLFGWQVTPFDIGQGQIPQFAPFTPDLQEHVRTQANYFPVWGISWVLLPLGLLVGFGKRVLPVICWWCVALIVVVRTLAGGPDTLQSPQFAWLWIIGVLLWINMPVMFWNHQRARWTWLLMAVPLSIIVTQMSYWIGSQLYSTRYFYEGLAALCLISALPLAWLARNVFNRKGPKAQSREKYENSEDLTTETPRTPRTPRATVVTRVIVYGLLAMALLHSLYNYSTARIEALRGFNSITGQVLTGLDMLRQDDRPVLVLVTGADSGDDRVTWRALAALNTVTSPYFDSEIVAAWNFDGDDIRQQILEQFPDRQLIEMRGEGNIAVFSLGGN